MERCEDKTYHTLFTVLQLLAILFLGRYNDPPYVKVKKLEVLTEVCNIDNAQNIVNELG